MNEVVSQCCYCRLPEYPEGLRISHGICDPCMEIYHPELAKKKREQDADPAKD